MVEPCTAIDERAASPKILEREAQALSWLFGARTSTSTDKRPPTREGKDEKNDDLTPPQSGTYVGTRARRMLKVCAGRRLLTAGKGRDYTERRGIGDKEAGSERGVWTTKFGLQHEQMPETETRARSAGKRIKTASVDAPRRRSHER